MSCTRDFGAAGFADRLGAGVMIGRRGFLKTSGGGTGSTGPFAAGVGFCFCLFETVLGERGRYEKRRPLTFDASE